MVPSYADRIRSSCHIAAGVSIMRSLRRLASIGAALLPLLVSGAQAQVRTLDDILKVGEIRVGVNPQLPPRALLNDKNEIDGFEPEIAKAIAEKLGVKLTLVP